MSNKLSLHGSDPGFGRSLTNAPRAEEQYRMSHSSKLPIRQLHKQQVLIMRLIPWGQCNAVTLGRDCLRCYRTISASAVCRESIEKGPQSQRRLACNSVINAM